MEAQFMQPTPIPPIRAEEAFSALVIVVLLVGIGLAVVAIVAFSRYLQHREMMKLLEVSGDAPTALRMRERWRKRAGLLNGMKLFVIGIMFIVMTQVSSTWLAMMAPKREVPTEWLTTSPAFLLVGLIFSAVGAIYVVAYAIWGRDKDGALGGTTDTLSSPPFTALDRRKAIVRGVALALVGGAVLALTPVFAVLGRPVQGEWLEVEHITGVIGVLLIVLGLTVGVAYGTIRTTPAPPESQRDADTGESDSAEEGQ